MIITFLFYLLKDQLTVIDIIVIENDRCNHDDFATLREMDLICVYDQRTLHLLNIAVFNLDMMIRLLASKSVAEK